jgi:hypothetical protein
MNENLGVATKHVLLVSGVLLVSMCHLSGAFYSPLNSLVKLLIRSRGIVNVNLKITVISVVIIMPIIDVRTQAYLMRHNKTWFGLPCDDQIA